MGSLSIMSTTRASSPASGTVKRAVVADETDEGVSGRCKETAKLGQGRRGYRFAVTPQRPGVRRCRLPIHHPSTVIAPCGQKEIRALTTNVGRRWKIPKDYQSTGVSR